MVGLINSKDEYKILPDKTFGEDLLTMYKTVKNLKVTENKPLKNDYTYVRHYVTQPYFEVKGTSDNKLKIKCYDGNNKIAYENDLSINSWIKLIVLEVTFEPMI